MLKRGIDLFCAVVALTLLSPLLAVAALVVLVSMGRPVLFRQVRPGLHGRPFTLYKLRTMRNATDTEVGGQDDARRVTRGGRLLRRLSLDELPQLWNVLKGEMSLVGPRPLLMDYLALYTPEQARRHLVRPGLTGWAQVHGRDHLEWEDRFRLDSFYADHQSLRLDLKIMRMTLRRLVDWRELESGVAPLTHVQPPRADGRTETRT